MPQKPKLAFYCQHLLGVGHLTRSFAIVNAIADSFDITFLQGGPDIGRKPDPSIDMHYLAPLQMQEADSTLYDPIKGKDVAEVFDVRMAQISEALQGSFDFLIVELFPFGRKKFKDEILAMITEFRARNPGAKVVCSLRDILVEKPDFLKRDQKIAKIVDAYFDLVFVHSDPKVLSLDATFSAVDSIRDKIIYTGFVTESNPEKNHRLPENGKRQILISQGGGVVGRELLESMAALVADLPDYDFLFSLGPNAPNDLRETLERIAGEGNNYQVVDFIHNFEEEMSRSALSVSLAGYNTVMNLLNCRVPALVYPYLANREQRMRANAVAKFGLMSVLSEGDLEKEALKSRLEFQLFKSYPDVELNLDGSANTGTRLLETLANANARIGNNDAERVPDM